MAQMKLAALRSASASNLAPRIGWEVRRAVRRLGLAAIIGAAALVLAALAAWQSVRLEQRRQQLEAELIAARTIKSVLVVAGPADTPGRLAAFNTFLPAHETIPEQLKQLVGIADKNSVTLAKADYKPQTEDGAQFMRYQITLPIKADYANIQAFIVQALHDMPTLTLDAVTFKRDVIETGDVDARVQFNLLVRRPVPRGVRP